MPWLTTDELNFVLVGQPGTATTSATTTETCTPVNLGMYDSVIFTVAMGANSVTTTNMFILECTATSALLASASTVIQGTSKYSYRAASSADIALGARTAGATTAVALSSTAGSITCVEMKNADLTTGFPYVMVSISSAAAWREATIVATLKPRYANLTMLKAVASS